MFDTPSWQDVEKIRRLAAQSTTYTQVLIGIGLKPIGANPHRLRMFFHQHGIDASHFTHTGVRGAGIPSKQWTDEEIFVCPSMYNNTARMKQLLIEKYGRSGACEECGLTEWREKPISMHLDHVNGNRADNRVENLKLLCPNCHSQTDTYCGKGSRKALKVWEGGTEPATIAAQAGVV